MPYFDVFPTINYNGQSLRNIMMSARLRADILANVAEFAPYTIRDGERPTTVAYNYYGDIQYIWMIALANDIIDFYSQWPKSANEMDSYIIAQYGSAANAQSTIDHYTMPNDPTYPNVTPTSYAYLSNDLRSQLIMVTRYDQAIADNDARRNIRLIPAAYAPRMGLELENALNQ